jgi:hypothetical protein
VVKRETALDQVVCGYASGVGFPGEHQLSLVRVLAELRRAYTGETDSTLMPATTDSTGQLAREDRDLVIETLGHNYVARLFG